MRTDGSKNVVRNLAIGMVFGPSILSSFHLTNKKKECKHFQEFVAMTLKNLVLTVKIDSREYKSINCIAASNVISEISIGNLFSKDILTIYGLRWTKIINELEVTFSTVSLFFLSSAILRQLKAQLASQLHLV